jgi:hypothetical protein
MQRTMLHKGAGPDRPAPFYPHGAATRAERTVMPSDEPVFINTRPEQINVTGPDGRIVMLSPIAWEGKVHPNAGHVFRVKGQYYQRYADMGMICPFRPAVAPPPARVDTPPAAPPAVPPPGPAPQPAPAAPVATEPVPKVETAPKRRPPHSQKGSRPSIRRAPVRPTPSRAPAAQPASDVLELIGDDTVSTPPPGKG